MLVHFVKAELPYHPLKDVNRLLLEVVLVIVNPSEQSGDEDVQVRDDETSGESDGEKLDQA